MNKTFLISWRGFVVLRYIGFIVKHSITGNHNESEVTALVQAGFFFSRSWEKSTDCFRFPMHVEWCIIKIRNTHVQNANQFDVSRYS